MGQQPAASQTQSARIDSSLLESKVNNSYFALATTSAKVVPPSQRPSQLKGLQVKPTMAARPAITRSTRVRMQYEDNNYEMFDDLPSDCNPDIPYTESKVRLGGLNQVAQSSTHHAPEMPSVDSLI